jgi:hypothetical protein
MFQRELKSAEKIDNDNQISFIIQLNGFNHKTFQLNFRRLGPCAGGIASDTLLCPFVIAKEAVKAQGKALSLSSSVICSAIRVKDTPPPDPPSDSPHHLLLPCSWSRPGLLSGKSSVFIDSGCSEFALMDTRFQVEHQIPTRPLTSPVPVFLADGATSPAGFITKETIPLAMNIDGHEETLVFKFVRLTHLLMVGLPWLGERASMNQINETMGDRYIRREKRERQLYNGG